MTRGNAYRRCLENQRWSGAVPYCERKLSAFNFDSNVRQTIIRKVLPNPVKAGLSHGDLSLTIVLGLLLRFIGNWAVRKAVWMFQLSSKLKESK